MPAKTFKFPNSSNFKQLTINSSNGTEKVTLTLHTTDTRSLSLLFSNLKGGQGMQPSDTGYGVDFQLADGQTEEKASRSAKVVMIIKSQLGLSRIVRVLQSCDVFNQPAYNELLSFARARFDPSFFRPSNQDQENLQHRHLVANPAPCEAYGYFYFHDDRKPFPDDLPAELRVELIRRGFLPEGGISTAPVTASQTTSVAAAHTEVGIGPSNVGVVCDSSDEEATVQIVQNSSPLPVESSSPVSGSTVPSPHDSDSREEDHRASRKRTASQIEKGNKRVHWAPGLLAGKDQDNSPHSNKEQESPQVLRVEKRARTDDELPRSLVLTTLP